MIDLTVETEKHTWHYIQSKSSNLASKLQKTQDYFPYSLHKVRVSLGGAHLFVNLVMVAITAHSN